jgi:hypothetical protein
MSPADEFINKVVIQDYDGVRQMLAAGHDVNAMKSGGVSGVGWNYAAEFAIPAADPVLLRLLWEAGASAANNPFLEQLFANFASGGDGSAILHPKVQPIGRFILHRFCGDEEFSVVRATIEAIREGKNYQLCFKVHTDGVCVKSLPDTQELKARPNAEVIVKGKGLSPRSLVGKTLCVPLGYNEEEENHMAVIYYADHEDLDDNEIKILSKKGQMFRVQWMGNTKDVNYYDGSEPNSTAQCSTRSSAMAPAGASGAIFLAACGRGNLAPGDSALAARRRCPSRVAADRGAVPGPTGLAATAARQAT